jgi:hypothetical protein
MLDFSVSGRLVRLLLAIILVLLMLGGITVWRNWVVAQALANATDTSALFQTTPPALVPITTPIWGTMVPFQQWNPNWLDATPTPGPAAGGAVMILPSR